MGTYTITVDERTRKGREFVSHLKSVGLIGRQKVRSAAIHSDEKEAFLHHSRISAARNFSKHL